MAKKTNKKKAPPKKKELAANTDCCGNCMFWRTIDEPEGIVVNECRRHAPQGSAPILQAKWPLTKITAWCGEFKRG